MQNFIQPGDVVTITAPVGGCTSGVGVLIGTHLFGVATTTVVATAKCEILRKGVVLIAKTSALAIAIGDALYWDDTNKVVNKTATAQKLVGVCLTAAANPSSTVVMQLLPNANPNL